MKKMFKFGLLVCVAAVFTTGCSINKEKYANGWHFGVTPMLFGNPYVDGNAKLVQNQPQMQQMYQLPNGSLIPMGGTAPSNAVVVVIQTQQPQNKLPLAPVFGINSGSQFQGYSGWYDSGAGSENDYQSSARVYYTQHYNISGPGVNSSYNGHLRPAGRSGGVDYGY